MLFIYVSLQTTVLNGRDGQGYFYGFPKNVYYSSLGSRFVAVVVANTKIQKSCSIYKILKFDTFTCNAHLGCW